MKIKDVNGTVIVPWDFSDLSKHALTKAVEMVDPSLIQVVHVSEYPTAFEYGVAWEMVNETLSAERLQTEFTKMNRDDSRCKDLPFNVLFGNPGNQISKFAEEQSAELILMSSHGRSGVARFLLGSVAERVLRMAHCPVMILREPSVSSGKKPSKQGESVSTP